MPVYLETCCIKSLALVIFPVRNNKSIFVSNLPYPCIICRKAEKVHGHDDLWRQPAFLQSLLYGTFQIIRIYIERFLADIYENRRSIFERYDFR